MKLKRIGLSLLLLVLLVVPAFAAPATPEDILDRHLNENFDMVQPEDSVTSLGTSINVYEHLRVCVGKNCEVPTNSLIGKGIAAPEEFKDTTFEDILRNRPGSKYEEFWAWFDEAKLPPKEEEDPPVSDDIPPVTSPDIPVKPRPKPPIYIPVPYPVPGPTIEVPGEPYPVPGETIIVEVCPLCGGRDTHVESCPSKEPDEPTEPTSTDPTVPTGSTDPVVPDDPTSDDVGYNSDSSSGCNSLGLSALGLLALFTIRKRRDKI
jgi:hypothetical protein